MFPRVHLRVGLPRTALLAFGLIATCLTVSAGPPDKQLPEAGVMRGVAVPLGAVQRADLAAKDRQLHGAAVERAPAVAVPSLVDRDVWNAPGAGKPGAIAAIQPSAFWNPEAMRAAKQAALVRALLATAATPPRLPVAAARVPAVKPGLDAALRGKVGTP